MIFSIPMDTIHRDFLFPSGIVIPLLIKKETNEKPVGILLFSNTTWHESKKENRWMIPAPSNTEHTKQRLF
jgi:hypothetical protein